MEMKWKKRDLEFARFPQIGWFDPVLCILKGYTTWGIF